MSGRWEIHDEQSGQVVSRGHSSQAEAWRVVQLQPSEADLVVVENCDLCPECNTDFSLVGINGVPGMCPVCGYHDGLPDY